MPTKTSITKKPAAKKPVVKKKAAPKSGIKMKAKIDIGTGKKSHDEELIDFHETSMWTIDEPKSKRFYEAEYNRYRGIVEGLERQSAWYQVVIGLLFVITIASLLFG